MSFFTTGWLIPPNATIELQAMDVTQSGGFTVQAFGTVLATDVPVIMSLFSSSRGMQISEAQTDRVTISGEDPFLRQSNIRIKVLTAPEEMAYLVGQYFRVDNSNAHPRGIPGLVPARTKLECSRFNMPQE